MSSVQRLEWGRIDTVTHSDEGEDVVHVGPDVDLHKAHHHSHLLEKELDEEEEKETAKRVRDPCCVCQHLKTAPSSLTYLSDTGIADPDDIEESGHDLGKELDTLEAERLEDEGNGLDHHGVVVGERRVSQDAHQSDDRHRRVKLIQWQVAHVHQHLAGAIVRWEEEKTEQLTQVQSKGHQ